LLADRIADTSTTDWTLARALRTGRFWIAAGYFCACLRTRCWCSRRNIGRAGADRYLFAGLFNSLL
jgi:hypothetical protein